MVNSHDMELRLKYYAYRFSNYRERPIVANEYELHESYPGSTRSQSISSIVKETIADHNECTIYENHTCTQSDADDDFKEDDDVEKKE